MTFNTNTRPEPPAASNDAGFRRVFVISSTLILATVFGWLGCLVRQTNGNVLFEWQWRALIWFAIGIGSTVYFWRQIWPAQNITRTAKRQIKGWVVLAIPCVIWMAYPLWFISGRQLSDVFVGLMLAVVVLTGGGLMVYKLIRGFENDEAAANADLPLPRTDPPNSAKQPPATNPAKTLGRDT